MARCNKGYEFCEDCSNQELSHMCDECDDGDLFEPLEEDSLTTHPLHFRRMPEAA